MIEIQNDMSERAIELLALPDDQPCFVLDIGCGSGLSGECLDEQGHYWIGIDISISMLSKSIFNGLPSMILNNILFQTLQKNEKSKGISFTGTWEMACPSVLAPSMEPSVSVLSNGFAMQTNLTTNQLSDWLAFSLHCMRACQEVPEPFFNSTPKIHHRLSSLLHKP